MSASALSRETTREWQTRALASVLQHVWEGSTFYRDRLARSGYDPKCSDPLACLPTLPFITRADLEADQAEHPPFGAMAYLEFPSVALVARSGVGFSFSGRRLNVAASHRDVQRHALGVRQALHVGGVRVGDRIYIADDPRYNPVSVYTVRAASDIGSTIVYTAAERTVRNARFVTRVLPPHAYFLTPTYALYLASILEQEGRKNLPVKALIGWGEPGFSLPGYRDRVRAAWAPIVADPDFRIVDVYAMAEAGVIAHGCAQGFSLHCPPDSVLVEVVEPVSGRHVKPGERGEVVVTQLVPVGMPLVRYRTGDSGILTDGCACGWPGVALRGLERIADLVEVAGRIVSANDVEEALGSAVPSFRIVRDAGGEALQLQVAGTDAGDPAAIQAQLTSTLGVPVRVERADPVTLPPFRHRRLRVMDDQNAALHAELHQDDVDLE